MNIQTLALPPQQTPCDLLVIGVPADALTNTLTTMDPDFGSLLTQAAGQDKFEGEAGAVQVYPTYGRWVAPTVALVGLGDGGLQAVRQAAGQAGKLSRSRGAETVVVCLGTLDAAQGAAMVEAFQEGNYVFDSYKAEHKPSVQTLLIDAVVARDDLDLAQAIAAGQSFARDLVNEPAAAIYPETLAQAARSLADAQLTVEIWDADRIRDEGMGGITAVGQGSDRPARFIHMRYTPAHTPQRRLALVGKGVTFDAGGLSLKPTAGMQTMRCDMAGGAAVIGAMKAIAQLRPPVEVHGIVGAVENMVNGSSYKLGDVLRMYSGKTVEVHNTDAEGRLVLADCLAFASKLGVDQVVDIATLTGAAVVALGSNYSGLFTDDDALSETLLDTARAAGEHLWRLPLPPWYKDQLKAQWGDIKNLGGREGGSITAALFLREFVDGPAWAHIDIAGPSFYDKPWRHFAPGGTGVMVPTLTRWVLGS